MIVYLYRWRIEPKKEDQFTKAWSYVTAQLREKSGSLGSRLHRGDDGLWYGYAQWPSIEAREKSNLQDDRVTEARRLMKDATIEMLPDVILKPESDLLILPSTQAKL
jgi:quinol monooxygenase YgiN